MRIPKRITLAWLRRRGACDEQRELFAKVFPDGLDSSRANLRLAARKGLNVDWLYDKFLSAANQRYYAGRTNKKFMATRSVEESRKYNMYAAPILADLLGLE